VAAELTVIRWRDIPMQVVARSGKTSARRLLSDRFQEAFDASAMVAGLIDSDDYTAEMTMDRRPCGDDLDAETQGEADRIEGDWTEDVLKAAIRAAGYRGREPA
jgi:Virulence factor